MAIFNSYVSLPEGMPLRAANWDTQAYASDPWTTRSFGCHWKHQTPLAVPTGHGVDVAMTQKQGAKDPWTWTTCDFSMGHPCFGPSMISKWCFLSHMGWISTAGPTMVFCCNIAILNLGTQYSKCLGEMVRVSAIKQGAEKTWSRCWWKRWKSNRIFLAQHPKRNADSSFRCSHFPTSKSKYVKTPISLASTSVLLGL
jgi:hypothetical protein